MEIENQICSLEQAKKLKELGITQNSLFYHYKQIFNGKPSFKIYPMQYEHFGRLVNCETIERALYGESKNEVYSAFTVAELGLMFPPVNISKGEFITFSKGSKNSWMVDISHEKCPALPKKYLPLNKDYTEAEIRAATIIYLLDKRFITVSEINNKITKHFSPPLVQK